MLHMDTHYKHTLHTLYTDTHYTTLHTRTHYTHTCYTCYRQTPTTLLHYTTHAHPHTHTTHCYTDIHYTHTQTHTTTTTLHYTHEHTHIPTHCCTQTPITLHTLPLHTHKHTLHRDRHTHTDILYTYYIHIKYTLQYSPCLLLNIEKELSKDKCLVDSHSFCSISLQCLQTSSG